MSHIRRCRVGTMGILRPTTFARPLPARNNGAREGGASFAGLFLPADGIAVLGDDLSRLVERGHRRRREHGASSDQGIELGH